MERRPTEREIVSQLLLNLDLPYEFLANSRTDSVVRLCLSAREWELVARMVSGRDNSPEFPGLRVEEICQAWRELPAAIWADDNWIDRVCLPVCKMARDYEKLILSRVVNA